MSVISAGTTTTTAFKVTGDTTGTLQLQTGAVPTTAINISATQVVTFPATTTLDFTGTLLLGDGSAAAPTLAHSGDTNTGIYFPGADQVAITTAGTQRFVVNASGNIGIGTSSPTDSGGFGRVVDVQGSTGAQVVCRDSDDTTKFARLSFDGGTTNTATIGAEGSDTQVIFRAGGGEKMRLDASGNLGLGVTPSAWSGLNAFQVSRGSVAANTSEVDFSHNAYYDGSNWKYIANGFATNHYQFNGGYAWRTAASGTAGNNITFTQTMTLDASGNLIVGGTSALNSAAGRGNITINGSSNAILNFGVGGAERSYIYYTGTDLEIYNTSNNVIKFGTNNAERARITSTGGFALGTTADPGAGNMIVGGFSNTIYGNATTGSRSYIELYNTSTGDMTLGATFGTASIRFATGSSNVERARITAGGDLLVGTTTGSFNRIVKSLSGNYALQVVNSSATNPYCIEFNMSGVTGGTGTAFLVCYDNANRLVIYGNGDVRNSNNSYGSLSDIKLKQDVADAASQWNDIKSLRVRKYRFKENPNAALQIGLIAQELEQVSPGLVDESPDRDREGNYLGTTTKAIKYSVLYMKSIKALQEAMLRIENLEAEVNALKAN